MKNNDSPMIKKFAELSLENLPQVGGKNSSLGEMYSHLSEKGIKVPNGFATTSFAYWHFLEANNIKEKLLVLMNSLNKEDFSNLKEIGARARQIILESKM